MASCKAYQVLGQDDAALVESSIDGKLYSVPVPCVVLFGDDTDCQVNVLPDKDWRSWFCYRGPMTEIIRQAVFGSDRKLTLVRFAEGKRDEEPPLLN